MKNITKNKKTENLQTPFPITSVCRADLEESGFDTEEVDDDTLRELASKMADAYCCNGFWTDLEILAEHLKIKKK